MSTEPVPVPQYQIPRRFPRYKLNVPVRVIVDKSDKVVIVQGRGDELNEGGMAIFAGVELSVGGQMAVEFTPPYSGNPIRVRCVVRDRRGYNYGVEFLLENETDNERVSDIRAALRGMGSPVAS
jgi:PilZ domain